MKSNYPKSFQKKVQKKNKDAITKSAEELLEEQEKIWQQNARQIVAEKEAELNGRISVNIPKKTTNYQHQQIQKEYDALAVKPTKPDSLPKLKVNEEVQQVINRAKRFSGIPVEEPVEQIERQALKGVNELPESFNKEARTYVYNYIHHHGTAAGDKVTEYPKLYPPKKEKAAKKEMARLREEHRKRRTESYSKHVGCSDEEIACTNKYAVFPEDKYSYKKYKYMEKERPNDADWEPEMTREEFMANQEKYRWEEYRRTQHLSINDTGKTNKESLWTRVKRKLGF